MIPQVKRDERLTVDQPNDMHITGSENRLVPLSTFCDVAILNAAARVEEVPAVECGAGPGRYPATGHRSTRR